MATDLLFPEIFSSDIVEDLSKPCGSASSPFRAPQPNPRKNNKSALCIKFPYSPICPRGLMAVWGLLLASFPSRAFVSEPSSTSGCLPKHCCLLYGRANSGAALGMEIKAAKHRPCSGYWATVPSILRFRNTAAAWEVYR